MKIVFLVVVSLALYVNAQEICPPDHSTTGDYYPHDVNCWQFYECVNGNAVVITCPAGLYWSQEELSCDYPRNVNCENLLTTIPGE